MSQRVHITNLVSLFYLDRSLVWVMGKCLYVTGCCYYLDQNPQAFTYVNLNNSNLVRPAENKCFIIYNLNDNLSLNFFLTI